MRLDLPERRRFIRAEVPLKAIFKADGNDYEVFTKNISPMGFLLEIQNPIKNVETLDMDCYIPGNDNPVKVKGKIAWQRKTSLEDNAPYHVGIEIIEVEDKSKNILLKFLCDMLYETPHTMRSW